MAGNHERLGRAFENVSLGVGAVLLTLIVLAELAVRLGVVTHAGPDVPASVIGVVASAFLPKTAGRLTRGGIWGLFRRRA